LAVARAQEEKLARDQSLNQKREADAAAKAVRSEVKQWLREHDQNREHSDIAFHFIEHANVRHLYVNADQQTELARGQLAIVSFGNRHYLVPTEMADKVQTRLPEIFVFRVTPSLSDTSPPEDLYSEHAIPDDLIW